MIRCKGTVFSSTGFCAIKVISWVITQDLATNGTPTIAQEFNRICHNRYEVEANDQIGTWERLMKTNCTVKNQCPKNITFTFSYKLKTEHQHCYGFLQFDVCNVSNVNIVTSYAKQKKEQKYYNI